MKNFTFLKPILLLIIVLLNNSCIKKITTPEKKGSIVNWDSIRGLVSHFENKNKILYSKEDFINGDTSFYSKDLQQKFLIANSSLYISNDTIFLSPGRDDLSIFRRPVEFNLFTFSTFVASEDTNMSIENEAGFFTNSIFDSLIVFEDCNFIRPYNFFNNDFEGTVSFLGKQNTIKNELIFTNNVFKKGIHFNQINISKDIVFNDNSICQIVDFSHTKFDNNSKILFLNTTLPDTLNLSYSNLSGVIDLTELNSNGKICKINLTRTDIDKIKMLYRNFELYFPNKMTNYIQYNDEISSVYEQLLANFTRNGFRDSYEKLDIEYKNWQSNIKGDLNGLALKISKFWWNYGYRKGRILYLTFGFIIIFTVLNLIFFKKLREQYEIEKLNEKYNQFSKKKWSIPKKIVVVLLYTGFIFFKFAIDFKHIKFKSLGWASFLILQYTVGLICTGFLINWVLKG